MSIPYIGEIRLFAGNFAPNGWLFCDGSTVAISDYDSLFQLIGTTYGGDGVSTFCLPDLRGRFPLHMGTLSGGSSYVIGQTGGEETHTLTQSEMPSHAHTSVVAYSTAATTGDPSGALYANTAPRTLYTLPGSPAHPKQVKTMMSHVTGSAGSGEAHENLMPYVAVNYIITPFGAYPSP